MRLHDGQPDEARVWCMGSNHGRYYPGLEHFDSDQFTIILQQDQEGPVRFPGDRFAVPGQSWA